MLIRGPTIGTNERHNLLHHHVQQTIIRLEVDELRKIFCQIFQKSKLTNFPTQQFVLQKNDQIVTQKKINIFFISALAKTGCENFLIPFTN